MSETPRTDEHEYGGVWETVVPAAFARSLERELTATREALTEITHAGTVAWARRRAERALDDRTLPRDEKSHN